MYQYTNHVLSISIGSIATLVSYLALCLLLTRSGGMCDATLACVTYLLLMENSLWNIIHEQPVHSLYPARPPIADGHRFPDPSSTALLASGLVFRSTLTYQIYTVNHHYAIFNPTFNIMLTYKQNTMVFKNLLLKQRCKSHDKLCQELHAVTSAL